MSSVPKIFVFKPKLREDIARRKQIAENTGRKVCRRAIYQLINPHRKAVRLATSWFDVLRITTNFKLFVHVCLNCKVSATIQKGDIFRRPSQQYIRTRKHQKITELHQRLGVA